MDAPQKNTDSSPFDTRLLTLPLTELVRLSAEEAQKYTQKRLNDSSIILALFYCACNHEDDAEGAYAAHYHFRLLQHMTSKVQGKMATSYFCKMFIRVMGSGKTTGNEVPISRISWPIS